MGDSLWLVPVLFMESVLVRITFLTKVRYVQRLTMFGFLLIGYGLRHYEISLPWSLSTVPYASFLIMVGEELSHNRARVEMAQPIITYHFHDCNQSIMAA